MKFAVVILMILCFGVIGVNCYASESVAFSNTYWTDTGLDLCSGTVIHVVATGLWNPWEGGLEPCDANGMAGDSSDRFLDANGERYAALIGYVGANPPAAGSFGWMAEEEKSACRAQMFLLGTDVLVKTPATGRLYLAMNDDAVSGNTSDNTGSLKVDITVVPEPSTLLALTGALGCMLPVIRRRFK